ncbi:sigma-70 family RNA polymerase sigma factor [Nocardioides panaciterrulae]|uniref:RNA polymerase sigma-B factor n=1 Tax=Nocardioides panaciterrulae TaxID=661492 RepID=A0A7Y9E7K0_9ACTN|nr:sigma-70 family RNA polymerase sigma factor [Nocardioides panaciterrulae]NYD42649.1 RNA polymerase sigma-B factor [Nocardioides panaciterrulae]
MTIAASPSPAPDTSFADLGPERSGTLSLPRERRIRLTAELLQQAADTRDAARREEILDRVVLMNMGVARTIAHRYGQRGVPSEDLEQVAYLALTRAARHFDVSMHHDFLSYAVPTVRGEIRKYFRDLGWFVRPPRRVQETQSKVVAARDSLSTAGGRPVTAAEIAEKLGEDVATVEEALAAQGCFTPTSLDLPVHDGATATLGDELTDSVVDGLGAAEARVVLAPLMRRLSDRDRRIVCLRFFVDRTQQEIAEEIGVTQMQVSRLLARILRDLRRMIEEEEAVAS